MQDIIRDLLRPYYVLIPHPSLLMEVVLQQTSGEQRLHELQHEERISLRLLVNNIRQRLADPWIQTQGIRNHSVEIMWIQSVQRNFRHVNVAYIQPLYQVEHIVADMNFIIPIGTHEEHATPHRVRQNGMNHIKHSAVSPLYIV